MDILFGDPFYHNIIYHLSMRDLQNLTFTCIHYKNNIPKYMKDMTINDIKNEFHDIFGDNYDFYKNKIRHSNNENEIKQQYNKYFIVVVYAYEKSVLVKNDVVTCSLLGDEIQVTKMYKIKYSKVDFRIVHDRYIFALYSLNPNSDIKKIKNDVYKNYKIGKNYIYWIENDSDKLFDLMDYL
jgi:hypothetical protein